MERQDGERSTVLRRVARLGMAVSAKIGKEVFYEATDQGRSHYFEFLKDRKKYLEPALHLLSRDFNIEALTTTLRTLSSAYEQAARSAASARGI